MVSSLRRDRFVVFAPVLKREEEDHADPDKYQELVNIHDFNAEQEPRNKYQRKTGRK